MLVLRASLLALAVTAFGACSSGSPSETATSTGSGGTGGTATTTSTATTTGTGGSTSTTTSSSSTTSTTTSSTTSSTTGGTGGFPTVSVPAIPCTDTLADVYVTPTGLPPMTDATRGDLVRCAVDTAYAPSQVQSQVTAKGITTPMQTGVDLFRVAFRTERGDGSPGVSTARVYLPDAPTTLPLPVLVIGHPTNGLAVSCTPSMDPTSNQDLALPWAGLGYAVIVPDYAGLGNEGTQSYLDNRDQGHAVLDGARALRKLLPAGVFDNRILAIGYSQGGGAVLSAQSLAKTYGADGDLAGVIVFAPEWPTRLNSFGYVDQLNNPTELTIQTGISENVVTVMRTYAYFYNQLGPTHEGDGFPVANQSGMDNAVQTLCQTPLGGYLQAAEPHVGDIFDETLRTTLLACIDGGATDPGCVDPGQSYYTYLENNFLTADPSGPPLLYVQGLLDYIMPAASEAACNIEKLQQDGVNPQVCVDPAAQHETIVARNMDFAIPWALALLGGQALPTCSSAGMPACTP